MEPVAPRLFLGIGAFVAGMAVIYWATSYEDAGTTMLTLAAVLSLWAGIYLWLQERRGGDADATGEAEEALYLPHASVWPLGIGVGAVMVLNGLLIGTPILVPGIVILVGSVAGFVQQTRDRD